MKQVIVIAAALAINSTACSNTKTTSTTTETLATELTEQKGDNLMAAPDITPKADGLITLDMCPTSYKHLRVEVSKDHSTAQIFSNNELLQTISNDENPLVAGGAENDEIHFVDANFDGMTDIIIGPCESRTYSTLLLWNDKARQFQRVGTLGEPSLQGFMIHVPSQSVIEGGSSSWCAFNVTRSQWNGTQLKHVEELIIITDSEQFGEYGVSATYTISDANHKVLYSHDDAKLLPTVWMDIANAYQNRLAADE